MLEKFVGKCQFNVSINRLGIQFMQINSCRGNAILRLIGARQWESIFCFWLGAWAYFPDCYRLLFA
jgi:hypothetical protein